MSLRTVPRYDISDVVDVLPEAFRHFTWRPTIFSGKMKMANMIPDSTRQPVMLTKETNQMAIGKREENR
jgi:hypothetical protein